MNDITDIIRNDGTWQWQTEHDHWDNNETMREFLNEYLPDEFEITLEDGTYAEIRSNGLTYEVHASGDGDSYNHKVEFKLI